MTDRRLMSIIYINFLIICKKRENNKEQESTNHRKAIHMAKKHIYVKMSHFMIERET